MRKLRVGLVGCGYIAQKAYLPLLTAWEGVELVIILSQSESRWNSLKQTYADLLFSTNMEDLIDQDVDAAFVLTPVESHYAISEELLKKQIDIFVEKPPTETAAETHQLAELAEKQKRVFMVGFNRRFAPLVVYAKSLFSPEQIWLCLLEKHRPGVQKRDLAEAYREDLIHQIDLARFLGGDAVPVATHGYQPKGLAASSASILRMDGGGIGVIAAGREAASWQERITIIGSQKTLRLKLFDRAELTSREEPPTAWTVGGEEAVSQLKARGFQAEIKHFFDCVQKRKKPLTNGFDAFLTQKLQEELTQLWVETQGV